MFIMGKTTINDRVRQIRESAGKTPAEFAVALGVSISLIQKIETKEKGVSQKMIDKFVNDWDVPEGWLINGVGEMYFTIPITSGKSEKSNPWKDEAYALVKKEMEYWRAVAMKLSGAELGKAKALVYAGAIKKAQARAIN